MMTIVIQSDCVIDNTFYRQGQVAQVDDNFDKTNIRKVLVTSVVMRAELQAKKNIISSLEAKDAKAKEAAGKSIEGEPDLKLEDSDVPAK